jgi:hypothetical protein
MNRNYNNRNYNNQNYNNRTNNRKNQMMMLVGGIAIVAVMYYVLNYTNVKDQVMRKTDVKHTLQSTKTQNPVPHTPIDNSQKDEEKSSSSNVNSSHSVDGIQTGCSLDCSSILGSTCVDGRCTDPYLQMQ